VGGSGTAMEQLAKGAALDALGKVDAGLTSYTGSTLATLRYYFDVNNSYVLSKLKLLFFPYRHAEWERSLTGNSVPLPPKDDCNAPDLYLPSMAFVTYILSMGFALAAQDRFTPDALGLNGSSGLAIMLLEVTAIKLAFYLSQGARLPFLDLCSYSGYKFLPLPLILVFRLAFGTLAGYCVLCITSSSIGVAMVKMLRAASAQGGSTGFAPGFVTEGLASPSKRERKQNYTLWGVAAAQLLWAWYLCRGV